MSSAAVLAFGVLSCVTVLGQAVSTPADASIERVATMQTARAAHTATTLPSGRVLIAGGMTDGGGSTAMLELFDPAANAIRALPPMDERRSGHTATLLRDGRVVIAGGYHGSYLTSIEIFDAAAGRCRAGGSLAQARSGHTATLLNDGRVLFTGGVGQGWTYLRSAEVYDPQTGRSELVESMTVPREGHTATLLDDGRVLVVGGHTGRRPNVQVYASAEVFSPETRRFGNVGSLLTARHKHDAIKLADGRVLVIAGADRSDRVHYATTEVFNPKRNAFERGPSMTYPRYKIAGTSVLLPGGNVLVTSGARVAESLDIKTWRFREVRGRLPAAYRFAAAAAIAGGDVLIAGGYSDANETTAGVWRLRAPPPR